jgi:hypothetical protein
LSLSWRVGCPERLEYDDRGKDIDCANSTPMSVARSIWAAVQGDPVFMRRVNGWLAIFWIAMIPLSLVTGWVKSVVYVSALSLWALVSGHWSAWQAARVEVAQEEELKRQKDDPVEERVVQKVLDETDVERSPTAS